MPIGVLGDRLRPRSHKGTTVSTRVIARRPAILLIAAVLLALCLLASLFVGSSRIPAGQVAHYLLHPDASNVSYNINVLRVQRTIIGVLVGTALAVAGAVMQAVTRNPLAEPGLLGVNAGASLGIVLGTAALGVLPITDQLALAAGGALVATALVQVIGMIGASTSSPVRLVLIGVAFSAFAGAVIRGVVLTMPNLFRTFIDWEVGSLTRTDIPLLPVAALVVAGTGAAVLLAGALDNIALGDDVATGQRPGGGEQLQAGTGGDGLGGLKVDEDEQGGIEHGNQLLSRVVGGRRAARRRPAPLPGRGRALRPAVRRACSPRARRRARGPPPRRRCG